MTAGEGSATSVNGAGNRVHGKKQLERLAGGPDETELPAEPGCAFVQRVDDNGVNRHRPARQGDPLQRICDQDGAPALSPWRDLSTASRPSTATGTG